MITVGASVLTQIVVFGSPCTEISRASQAFLIDEEREEMKGYKTHHVRNVETVKDEQNQQLRCVHLTEKEER